MDWNLKITDMEGHTPEHSSVIVNFVAAIRHQLKNSTCYVYSDNVQYRFKDNQGNNKIVIPDASIKLSYKIKTWKHLYGCTPFCYGGFVTLNRKI